MTGTKENSQFCFLIPLGTRGFFLCMVGCFGEELTDLLLKAKAMSGKEARKTSVTEVCYLPSSNVQRLGVAVFVFHPKHPATCKKSPLLHPYIIIPFLNVPGNML